MNFADEYLTTAINGFRKRAEREDTHAEQLEREANEARARAEYNRQAADELQTKVTDTSDIFAEASHP